MMSKTLTLLIAKNKNGTISADEQVRLDKKMESLFKLNELNNRQLEIIKKTGWVKPIDADIGTIRFASDAL